MRLGNYPKVSVPYGASAWLADLAACCNFGKHWKCALTCIFTSYFVPIRSVWDLSTGKEKNKMVGHSLNVSHVAISQDGKNIISTSHDKTVR